MQNKITVKVGQRFPLTIKRLGINGEGIGYFKHKIVFVPFALPQEVITAEVTTVNQNYLNARVTKIRQASPQRVIPKDNEVFGKVGGIELEDLAYDAQLRFKTSIIKQALAKFKPQNYQNYVIKPTIGMTKPYYYRNKAQFQVKKLTNGKIIAGLYAPNSHHLIDLPHLATQSHATMQAMRTIVDIFQQIDMSIYDEKRHTGAIRTIVIREAQATHELQVTLVTHTAVLPQQERLLMMIKNRLPQVVSVMQNINPNKTSLVWGDKTKLLAGKPQIREMINNYQYDLSARAFFQLNPQQTARLYRIAANALNLTPQDNLVDAYCGVGTLGISMANAVNEVRGMDIIPEAITDANHNATINHITNAHYEVGSAEVVFDKWLRDGFRPTALIVDPPRTGLDQQLINNILKTKPAKFVYVSCNPSTLARDLVKLAPTYHVDWMQSVDMFPQTARVEVVTKLSLKK